MSADIHRRYTCVLIGLGSIGMMYDYYELGSLLTHAQAIKDSAYFTLIAGIDIDEEKRRKFHAKFGVPTYPSISDIDKNVTVDLVIIATPSKFHIANFREALSQLSPKAFLCEKPVGLSYVEARSFFESEVPLKVKERTYVNYIRRADPSTIEIQSILESYDYYSAKTKGYCYYTKGVFNTASHFLDLLQVWFGPCKGVSPLGASTSASHDSLDINSDFVARFQNAEVVFLSGDHLNYGHYGLDLYFNCGRIRYDFGGEVITFYKIDNNNSIDKSSFSISSQLDLYQRNIYVELYNALSGRKSSLATLDQALHTLKYMDMLR